MTGLFWRLAKPGRLRRWRKALEQAETLPVATLAGMQRDIHAMRHEVDTLAARTRDALTSRIAAEDGIARPEHCDWAYRPAPWRNAMHPRGRVSVPSPTDLGGGVRLFHDAGDPEITLTQQPRAAMPAKHISGAAYGIVLEVYRFDGSFISLAQDLPEEASRDLGLSHVICVSLTVEREHPVEIYARLNIQHGPNTETLVREVHVVGETGTAEFDLAYSRVNEKRIEKAWLDLIIEGPEMTRVALWDMTMTRAPRADI